METAEINIALCPTLYSMQMSDLGFLVRDPPGDVSQVQSVQLCTPACLSSPFCSPFFLVCSSSTAPQPLWFLSETVTLSLRQSIVSLHREHIRISLQELEKYKSQMVPEKLLHEPRMHISFLKTHISNQNFYLNFHYYYHYHFYCKAEDQTHSLTSAG